MNTTEIFSIGLGLSSPWFVEHVEFLEPEEGGNKELHLYLNFERGYKFTTEKGIPETAYDTIDKTWQHLNFFQHRCYLHARVPRIKTGEKGIEQISVPWARQGSGFTLLFEAYSMLLIESEMPVSKVSECVQVTAPRIWRVFTYWISKALAKDDLSRVTRIGLDETSRKKGHNYVTVFADLEQRRVIHVCQGKDADTVKDFTESLERKGGKKENIEIVSMDMSPAFISGVMDNLPDSHLVFDKFHLIQSLNKALEEVRISERKGNVLLKGHKYTILKKYGKLSSEKRSELDYLLIAYPNLGEAYRLREMFAEVFTIAEPHEAKGYLAFWCDMAFESKIEPFRKFVAMIKSHWSGIAAYFDKRVTNGVPEGINSKIQLAKRRARGYRNIDNFINMRYNGQKLGCFFYNLVVYASENPSKHFILSMLYLFS
jgi:transposase